MPLVMVKSNLHYEEESIYRAVSDQLDALGVRGELNESTRVVIKPNLLAARVPEQSTTTHPFIIRAVARYLHEAGVCSVTIAESPGGAWSQTILNKLYNVTGMRALEDVAELSTDITHGDKNGFSLLKPVLECDYIINCAKLKTHGLTVMTGAVKNLFGCIPGLQKPEWHCRKPGITSFCKMLIKLCETVKPNVSILDAVSCMQGNGPGGGESRYMGYLLASRSAYAVDETAARLMGYKPENMPLIREARNLVPMSEPVEISGDEIVPADPPFTLPDAITGSSRFYSPKGILHVFYRRTVPAVDLSRCTGCGKCAESCPKHIITIKDRKARMHSLRCISCFCCQEMCPSHAIGIKKRIL